MMSEPLGPVAQRIALVGAANICTSIIVGAELRYGAAKKQSERLAQRVEATLTKLVVMPVNAPVDRIYGNIRSRLERAGKPIGDYDLLIAAHALALDCILVTDDEDEFRRVPGLSVENWLRSG